MAFSYLISTKPADDVLLVANLRVEEATESLGDNIAIAIIYQFSAAKIELLWKVLNFKGGSQFYS